MGGKLSKEVCFVHNQTLESNSNKGLQKQVSHLYMTSEEYYVKLNIKNNENIEIRRKRD